ncbi:MAG: phage holin family protein [Acidobacteria bacterium]|nr:phage holin family protein [Acidobacteriota bacterium]
MEAHDRRYAEEHTLGELFSELTTDARTLVRQELELAKTEMREKAAKVGKDAGLIALGGVLLYVGTLVLIAAAVIGLGHLIGYGLSALLIGVVVAGTGAAIALGAKKDLQKSTLTPEETKKTMKETKTWIRSQVH